jgi:hypothetical protein
MKTIRNDGYSFAHTKQRLKERYDLDITRAEYEALCVVVAGLTGFWEKTDGDDQKITKATFKNRLVTFVWSQHRYCITTVLPA